MDIQVRHDHETRQKSFYQAEAARQYVINIADPVMEELYGVSVLAYFNMQQHEGYQIINIPIYENSEVTKWNNNFNSINDIFQYTFDINNQNIILNSKGVFVGIQKVGILDKEQTNITYLDFTEEIMTIFFTLIHKLIS